ncbi:EamA family transporter [Romboutsia sp. 1001216sp1]|uniref:EamA family transporter n=1 Tax=Romboutsia TaxID=1501226 RepID=UPI000A5A5FCD|nr:MULTISPECIES: EamA family transporter [Romboutsia]MDB8791456.1 EamA family transporter [Romboutsia sp. 1001216sp1]MDB8794575.1 EamA family transporter [Romboutsia sp. 1001216sp1]MDB8796145.1 EamA family transporter [Romboutsia sp. 1001216sp1]MDB8798138.1 EamA family transporter [Romboutsia sp. 1001216sp1]MDB8801138.1 EamA family transporter [Romboutsia sp. 1001216sp1]
MSNWLFYALLAAISASFVTVFSKVGVTNLSPSLATSVRAVIMGVFLVLVSFIKGDFSNLSSLLSHKKDLLFLIFAGVSGALSWLFLNIALKTGKTWQVAPIDKLSVVLTVIFSILIFKEQISVKGIIGVLFIAIGTIFVALG